MVHVESNTNPNLIKELSIGIFEGFVHRHFLKSMCWFQGVYVVTKVLLRNYPKIGHEFMW